MRLNSGGGGKHIATTARKEKPDGTREVSHKVEHHYDTMQHLRSARQYKTQRGVPLAKPLKPRDSSGVHHAIAGRGPHDRTHLDQTINALRDAMLGDGRLERPAPGLTDSRVMFEDATGTSLYPRRNAGTADTQNTDGLGFVQNPLYSALPAYPEYPPIAELVPRYKGGFRRRGLA